MQQKHSAAQRKNLARNLRQMLQEENITMSQLAHTLAVKPATVSSWCNGVSYPTKQRIQQLYELYQVSEAELTAEKIVSFDDALELKQNRISNMLRQRQALTRGDVIATCSFTFGQLQHFIDTDCVDASIADILRLAGDFNVSPLYFVSDDVAKSEEWTIRRFFLPRNTTEQQLRDIHSSIKKIVPNAEY